MLRFKFSVWWLGTQHCYFKVGHTEIHIEPSCLVCHNVIRQCEPIQCDQEWTRTMRNHGPVHIQKVVSCSDSSLTPLLPQKDINVSHSQYCYVAPSAVYGHSVIQCVTIWRTETRLSLPLRSGTVIVSCQSQFMSHDLNQLLRHAVDNQRTRLQSAALYQIFIDSFKKQNNFQIWVTHSNSVKVKWPI